MKFITAITAAMLCGCLSDPEPRVRVWDVDCTGRALRDTVIGGQRVGVIDSCRIVGGPVSARQDSVQAKLAEVAGGH